MKESLSSRQIEILKELLSFHNNYITSSKLSKYLDCSSKTIQEDIRYMMKFIEVYGCSIIAKRGIGYTIQIIDHNLFREFVYTENDSKMVLYKEEERVHYILTALFNSTKKQSRERLKNELFVSESRFNHDLKAVDNILLNYNLKLVHTKHKCISIGGNESDCRKCIKELNITLSSVKLDETEVYSYISNSVLAVLYEKRYITSDIAIQNLVLHINCVLKRNLMGYAISSTDINVERDSIIEEFELSTEIINRIGRHYQIEFNDIEKVDLASNILGKKDNIHLSVDTNIDCMCKEIFRQIKKWYRIDFSYQVENRLKMSLSILSLINRAKYDNKVEISLLDDIKINVPLAFDLAVISSKIISDWYSIDVVESEIGYLALHFVKLLDDLVIHENANIKILIISPSNEQEILLIKRNFMKLFSNYVNIVEFINIIDLNENILNCYDIALTTYKNIKYKDKIVEINYFFDDKDRQKIWTLLLDKKSTQRYIFNEKLFIHFKSKKSKIEVLKTMSEITELENDCCNELYQSLLEREELGLTACKNGVAILHPYRLLANVSTITVAVFDYPVHWENETNVKMVILLCGSSSKCNQLQMLFDKISSILKNQTIIEDILHNPSAKTISKYLNI